MNSEEILNHIGEDKDIQDASVILSYLDIISENLRINYRRINRNSLLLLISAVLYLLIFVDDESIGNITILFLEFRDTNVLLNLIPVFFSYVLLNNVALWINCTDLNHKVKELAQKAFKLGILSDSVNLIRPFSILHDLIDYQLNNKKIRWIYKIPLTIGLVVLFVSPAIFVVFTLYVIARYNYLNTVSVVCFILTSLFFISILLRVIVPSKCR